MNLYGQKDKSVAQKTVIITLELMLLCVAYWILFGGGGSGILTWIGMDEGTAPFERRMIIFGFSVIVFLRMGVMMIWFLKRKIPWEETFSVPLAFALYYVGFSLLVLPAEKPLDLPDYFAILIFVSGSLINTGSELQRHLWKKRPENKGKLYTGGLFRYSMHINFFGDLLWVSAYAIVTRNYFSIAIPLLLFCLFAFYNIPKLDAYLHGKYGHEFESFSKRTKRFIPFIY